MILLLVSGSELNRVLELGKPGYKEMNNQYEQKSVNKHESGEIFKIGNSLCFLLLNVTFMDSGTYTVSTMEDSVVKGETGLLVARQTVFGQHDKMMNITFMCNKMNISSIKIEMMIFTIVFPVLIYDVSHANCTEVGDVLKNRIESCLFNGITLSLTIRSLTWLERGTYAAWGDQNFLLDSVFVEIEDTKRSSLETRKGYVTLLSTANGPTDSSKFAKETGNNELSSTELSHGYFDSSFAINIGSYDEENEVWVRILFAAVGVAVAVSLTVASTLLILWRRRSLQFTCMGPDINSEQGMQMEPISKTTTIPAATDERQYEELRSYMTGRSIYLEAVGIETAHTEDNNPGRSCSKEYEKLHPFDNQGNNTYSSLGAEHILEVRYII
ncbi:hypothetical protein ACJMK2_024948 [Sinanodonta woodiana]|uniref:Uncharacterized protein n=1 Tax=Sinanodonta woodiana TaxID=1069815 RepID=A0ABD3XFF9_SINWO